MDRLGIVGIDIQPPRTTSNLSKVTAPFSGHNVDVQLDGCKINK